MSEAVPTTAGVGIAQDISDISTSIQSGDWAGGAISGLSGGLDALGFIANPADALLGAGISWLIEHIEPLNEALDMFAGDPGSISSYAATWRQAASGVRDAGEQLGSAVTNDLADWHGTAAEAYQAQSAEQQDGVHAAAAAAEGVASAIEAAGALVAAVRELVRDLIADCVAEILTHIPIWLAAEGCSLGLATPGVIADAVYLIAKWV